MKNFKGSFLIILLLFVCIYGQDIQEYDEMIEGAQDAYKESKSRPEQLLQVVREAVVSGFEQQDIKANLQTYLRRRGSGLMASTLSAEDSPELCMNHTNFAMNVLMNGVQEWALRMFDAVDKFPSGFLDGNMLFLGSYDECERIYSVGTEEVNLPPFRGQYCMVYLSPSASLTGGQSSMLGPPLLKFGICLPDSCGNQDAMLLAQSVIPSAGNDSLNVIGAVCQEHTLDLDAKAIVMLIICSLLIVLIACGTAYDVIVIRWPQWSKEAEDAGNSEAPLKNRDLYQPLEHDMKKKPMHESGLGGQILLVFSLYTNSSKLLSAKSSEGTLSSVNGIRVISMTWVILGHTYAFGLAYTTNNLTFMQTMLKRWSFMAIVNAEVSVDTFFALSGLLVAYLTLREMQKNNGKMNWIMFYFHRFWRLTPCYMLVLGVYHCLSAYWFDGPEWPQQGMEYDTCHKNWWTNLLYINNLVNADEGCMAWSWYLANDMQFYIVSPLLFIPLYYSTVLGLVVCGAALIIMTIIPFVISYAYDMPPSLFGGVDTTSSDNFAYFTKYYVKPYCRMGPYIIGIVTGFILYKTKCKVKLNPFVNLAGWLLATGLALVVLYGVYEPLNGSPMSVGVSALYNATHKTVWGACICWVIFACSTRNGGYVNTFLSWEAYIPLGRLTYCAYLVHPILMYTYLYGLRSPLYFWDLEVMFMYFGFLVWSYCVAYITSLLFESPMMGLEKALLKRR